MWIGRSLSWEKGAWRQSGLLKEQFNRDFVASPLGKEGKSSANCPGGDRRQERNCGSAGVPYNQGMKTRVLCLLAGGFEELELVAPVDLLRRAGAEVVLASLVAELEVAGRNAMVLRADQHLDAINPSGFDLLFVPGGPAVARLRADGRAAELAAGFAAAGKPVAAICAAPLLLNDAGLLEGRRFTAHFSTLGELPGALTGERVVEDGLILTSRGAGTAVEFGLALVDHLFGEAAEEEIARSIMV